jgi:hypothetical protein
MLFKRRKERLAFLLKLTQNLSNAIAQLRTALDTEIPIISEKAKRFPSKVILSVSGKINDRARHHIVDTIKDPRIEFEDADDLIPLIDIYIPEFWFGIEVNKSPYLTALRDMLLNGASQETGAILDAFWCPADEENFVSLKVNRIKMVRKTRRGQTKSEPEFEEFPIIGILNKSRQLSMITADAGMGKTTAMRRLAVLLIEKALGSLSDAKIPIFLKATNLSTAHDNFVRYLSQHTSSISRASKAAF